MQSWARELFPRDRGRSLRLLWVDKKRLLGLEGLHEKKAIEKCRTCRFFFRRFLVALGSPDTCILLARELKHQAMAILVCQVTNKFFTQRIFYSNKEKLGLQNQETHPCILFVLLHSFPPPALWCFITFAHKLQGRVPIR